MIATIRRRRSAASDVSASDIDPAMALIASSRRCL
jgi:hypothetical protein